MKLLIVGNPLEHHVGAHFLAAARELGWEVDLVDVRGAWSRSRWVNRFCRTFLDAFPVHLGSFSDQLLDHAAAFDPQFILATGVAPVSERTLALMRRRGACVVNYLTDDPWNPRNGAGFFWRSLPEYDCVLTTRRSNVDDLRKAGCRRVAYVPFGYNPSLHYPEGGVHRGGETALQL